MVNQRLMRLNSFAIESATALIARMSAQPKGTSMTALFECKSVGLEQNIFDMNPRVCQTIRHSLDFGDHTHPREPQRATQTHRKCKITLFSLPIIKR